MLGILKKATFAVAAVLALGVSGGAADRANAATLAVDNTFPDISPLRGTLTCTACEGLVAPLTFSTTNALLHDLGNSGDATELAWVNSMTGSAFASGAKTDPAPSSFLTNALYILIKIGRDPNVMLIKNTFGAGLAINWAANQGQGAGISHYTEYGTAPAAIPVPAAGFLLIGALGGLAALRRRKTA